MFVRSSNCHTLLTCLVLEPVHEVLELLLVQGERRDLLHRLDKPRLQGLEGAHVQLTGGERKIWKQMNLFIYTGCPISQSSLCFCYFLRF